VSTWWTSAGTKSGAKIVPQPDARSYPVPVEKPVTPKALFVKPAGTSTIPAVVP
jgi:hypothetical protein